MKVRLEFEKNIRYISHLELMRCIQRILKRSTLPLRYSEGFNPHIILSIASPIPVGVCGKSEYADFEIKEDMEATEIFKLLCNCSDNGIKTISVQIGNNKNFNDIKYAKYSIEIETDNRERLVEFLKRDEILVEKKAKGKIKIINLKDYIHSIDFYKTDNGIFADGIFYCGNEKNLNPMLIRKALIKENIEFNVFNADRLYVMTDEKTRF